MYANNFTRAPEGQPDIELTCYRDNDEARRLWEENFKTLKTSGHCTFTRAFYIDCGNVPDDESIDFVLKGERAEKIRLLSSLVDYSKEEIETWDEETIQTEIFGQYEATLSLLNYHHFNKVMLKGYKLDVVPSKTVEWVKFRGYRRGDYAEVAYCPDDLEKAWGRSPSGDELKEYFTRLFYDAPIFSKFTIDGEEYYYGELMPDGYEWDKEGFATAVSEKSGVDRETLLNMLPEYLD